MLDLFTVVDKGGIVVWQKQLAPVSSAVVNGALTDIFIAGSSAESYVKSGYTVKWTTANDLGLIFIVVYQSLLKLGFVEEFLENMKRLIVKLHGVELKEAQDSGKDVSGIVCHFDHYFEQRLSDLEAQCATSAQAPTGESESKTPVVNAVSSPGPGSGSGPLNAKDTPDVKRTASPKAQLPSAAKVVGGRRAVASNRRASGKNSPITSSVPSSEDESATNKPVRTKVLRKWREDGTVDDSGNTVLDFSTTNGNSSTPTDVNLDEFIGQDEMEKTKSGQMVIKDLSTLLSTDDSSVAPKSGVFSFFSSLVSGRSLTSDDLAPAMENMRQHLLGKNVANEVCIDICNSVSESLVGRKTSTFNNTASLVRSAMEASLRRILTPTTSLDLLNDISRTNRTSHRPYTMSFIGVNGVGKSTNLSKVAYWLLGNNLRVLIVACDTFRSGAVEQLRVHVHRLGKFIEGQGRPATGEVEIFERGYGKDPASIASDAITYATKHAFDVVLIDTAGRRHTDTRLMSGLERFVSTVRIDKVWQVAEALVGSDAVGQARHFNEALGPRRNLDGFIISKVDTVGDLVGTLVSMVYVTGVPVVFVGVGQMYTDLRGLSVDWVLQMLLS